MNDIAIRVENLGKAYKLYQRPVDRLKEALHPLKKKYHKNFNALSNISFEIRKGETVGIVGKNGSGKSTLLKLITGVTTPSSGKITVNGRISAILELGSGFNPEMSGLDNIYLNTSINGMSKKEADGKIKEIIAFAELGEFIHQPLKTYSSGMRARLAFAVSISIEPDILIVDEALSVGDAAFARKCFAKMEDIRAKGATILFVSHSEASVVALCNRAIWISNGQQIIDGSPKLVTGLYMKNVTKQAVNRGQIQEEFDRLTVLATDADPAAEDKQDNQKNAKPVIEEYYNSELKPRSTIYYEEKGARIRDVKITTLSGKVVNVLHQGKEYIYSYVVEPTAGLKSVQFGFLIKGSNGVPIGGGAYPARDEYLDRLEDTKVVKIKFICLLNDGHYFLNCGVMAMQDGKISYAHRILDALMIRVLEGSSMVTAPVNLIRGVKVEEVDVK